METSVQVIAAIDAVRNPFEASTREHERIVFDAAEKWADRLGGDSEPSDTHPDAIYSPEVFEAMQAVLKEASGSPTHALRLVLSRQLNSRTDHGDDPRAV